MADPIDQAREAMEKTLKALDRDFAGLRTGRPSASILKDVKVDYYGVPTPVTQLAAVKTPEPHLLVVEPWDKSITNAIEHAIIAANLGVTPNNDGKGTIRLPFPAPTEERRKEIVRDCRQVAERARVGVRGARHDAKNKLERQEKDGDISEDDLRRLEDKLQDVTDEYIGKIDKRLEEKEADVMEI